jgi:hypothetical protein
MGAHLNSKTSSVNIIPKEKVVCVIKIPTNFKYLHKVILRDEVKASVIRGSMLNVLTYCPCISPTTVRNPSTSDQYIEHYNDIPVMGLFTLSTFGSAANTSVLCRRIANA